MTEEEILEVIEAVCKRPKLYTWGGSFFEVISFIDGCGTASADIGMPFHSALTPFLTWLAEPDDQGRKLAISGHELRNRFSSDEEAILEFAASYRKYFEDVMVSDGRREDK